MSTVVNQLFEVRESIAQACSRAGRDTSAIELVAVSKTFSEDVIREAHEAGQVCFGESKVQEFEAKMAVLPASLRWHFIGRVQRNKVRRILQSFEVIHAIDSLKLASYADGVAADLGLLPKVFLQVNLGEEVSKGGFSPDDLRAKMNRLRELPHLDILGLMCIPPVGCDPASARPWFASLRQLRDELEIESNVKLPSLSMGMSGDYEVAIEEGSTHVRVGSAIFGNRAYRVDGELG